MSALLPLLVNWCWHTLSKCIHAVTGFFSLPCFWVPVAYGMGCCSIASMFHGTVNPLPPPCLGSLVGWVAINRVCGVAIPPLLLHPHGSACCGVTGGTHGMVILLPPCSRGLVCCDATSQLCGVGLALLLLGPRGLVALLSPPQCLQMGPDTNGSWAK